MRKISFLFGLMMMSAMVFAQAPLKKGEKHINAGLGLTSRGIPIYGGMEFGVGSDITVGFEGSFRFYSENYDGNSYNHTIIGILGRGDYHFNRLLEIPSNFDFYGGLNIGFNVWNSPSGYGGSYSSGLGIGLQLGGRYFFQNNLGLNFEIGGGNSLAGAKFGITYLL